MTKIVQLKDSDDTIFPVPAHRYKYYQDTQTDTWEFGDSGVWLVMTGRYGTSSPDAMGLYLLTTRTISAKGQMREVVSPAGVTLSYNSTTGILSITTTVKNIYVCALAMHVW